MRQTGLNQMTFLENDHAATDVLRFLADNRIPITKLERLEPTLESLFMEVTKK